MSVILMVLAGFLAVISWVIAHAWLVFSTLGALWVLFLVLDRRPETFALLQRRTASLAVRAARAIRRRRATVTAPPRRTVPAQRAR